MRVGCFQSEGRVGTRDAHDFIAIVSSWHKTMIPGHLARLPGALFICPLPALAGMLIACNIAVAGERRTCVSFAEC